MHERGLDSGPLSILHLCAPAHVGGLERVVQGLSSGQVARNHRVAVAAVVEPESDTSAFVDPIRLAGVECILIEVTGRGYFREVRAVRRILDSWQPDVLHTHGYRSDLLHGGAARRRNIATVTTLHGSSRMGGASHVFEWLQEWALRRFDAVVAVSRPLVASLLDRGVDRERIHEVPNAWTPPQEMVAGRDARRLLHAPEDGLLLGWVGRLIPVKGCDIFLRALARLEVEGWVARIVGDGPERDTLEELSRSLGLDDRVRFLGAVPDAARFFKGFDVFVLSSRSEGTPMVLLEAMGAGSTAVATSVGGVPDVLQGSTNGWMVPSEDIDALAAAMTEALEDSGAREARGKAAETRVHDTYGFDPWIQAHDRVYRAALDVRFGRA